MFCDLHYLEAGNVIGIELNQFDALLPDQMHRGRSFGDRGAAGGIAMTSAE